MATFGMISATVADVRRRIAAACARVGRDSAAVTLIGVTKTVSVDRIGEATAAGLTVFGENRVQEAAAKIEALRQTPGASRAAEWHLIGTLQRNKVRQAVELFDLVHSVESVELAQALERHACAIGKRQAVLIQVNVTGEATKHGVAFDRAEEVAGAVAAMPGLSLRGLMTMAALGATPEATRAAFRQLRQIGEQLARRGVWAAAEPALSMGMSDDFEIAVEEGATMVRIGRALFGERGPRR